MCVPHLSRDRKTKKAWPTSSFAHHDENKTIPYSLPERPRSSGYNRKVINGSDKSRKNVFKTHAAK
jgi:hypothetical protein